MFKRCFSLLSAAAGSGIDLRTEVTGKATRIPIPAVPGRATSAVESSASPSASPTPLAGNPEAAPQKKKKKKNLPETEGPRVDPFEKHVASLPKSITDGLVPSPWKRTPVGFTVSFDGLKATKKFEFGDYLNTKHWMGRVMLLSTKLGVDVELDWFYTCVEVSLPCSPNSEVLALYMNDQEVSGTLKKNFSKKRSKEPIQWDEEYMDSIDKEMAADFCWLLTQDREQLIQFLGETYLQWHHRADYLVHRKSRQKKEFRQNMTFNDLMKDAQKRKRRVERRESKEAMQRETQAKYNDPEFQQRMLASARGAPGALKLRSQKGQTERWTKPGPFTGSGVPTGNRNGDPNGDTSGSVFSDVIPRELREQLDREPDGSDDHKRRNGQLSHTYRNTVYR